MTLESKRMDFQFVKASELVFSRSTIRIFTTKLSPFRETGDDSFFLGFLTDWDEKWHILPTWQVLHVIYPELISVVEKNRKFYFAVTLRSVSIHWSFDHVFIAHIMVYTGCSGKIVGSQFTATPPLPTSLKRITSVQSPYLLVIFCTTNNSRVLARERWQTLEYSWKKHNI